MFFRQDHRIYRIAFFDRIIPKESPWDRIYGIAFIDKTYRILFLYSTTKRLDISTLNTCTDKEKKLLIIP